MSTVTPLASAQFFTPEQRAALGFEEVHDPADGTAVASPSSPTSPSSSAAASNAARLSPAQTGRLEKLIAAMHLSAICAAVFWFAVGAEGVRRLLELAPYPDAVNKGLGLVAALSGMAAFGSRLLNGFPAAIRAYGGFGVVCALVSFVPILGDFVVIAIWTKLEKLRDAAVDATA